MKRFFSFFIIIIICIATLYFIFNLSKTPSSLRPIQSSVKILQDNNNSISHALALLRARKDNEALVIFDKLCLEQPQNIDALWGKAEVLRRRRDYKDSENILQGLLKNNPRHAASLISLAYIRYKDDELNEALKLINRALENKYLDKENQALCFMMLGTINSRRCFKGGLFSKIKYCTKIRSYFLKAKELGPDLPEVHLGLGTFYLLAPAIIGGNSERAFKELELALKLSPDFATANARLAQCYKKKGDLEKYNCYIKRTMQIDPENEVLREIK